MNIIIHQSKRIISVWDKVHILEPTRTFHEFCISMIKHTFGVEWYETEIKKEDSKKHTVAKWYDIYNACRMEPKEVTKIDDMDTMPANGGVWSLLSLGYDLLTLYDKGLMDNTLIKRLKNYGNFQGARYEIMIAAILLRYHFDVKFIHINDTHSEMLATHKHWGETIEIEAKSKHRKGVLNFEAGSAIPEEIKVGIHHQLNDAMKHKSGKHPFFIFIDLNMPLSKSHPKDKQWWNDLIEIFDFTGKSSQENPDKYTCLVLTNFSYHYENDKTIYANEYSADSGMVIPKYSENPLKHPFYTEIIDEGLHQYGQIPATWDKLKNKKNNYGL